MKEEYARGFFLYSPPRTIERKLLGYVTWFDRERPHQGIGLRTPDEAHFGKRRRRFRTPSRAILAVRFLGGDRELPTLRLRRVA
ncbi:MAG: hypothetical protein ACT4PV_16275 [Planctomycetaceae bacterium]